MITSLYTATTGMLAQELGLDVVANNLANVNTTGFKKSKTDFEDLMYQMFEEPGTTEDQAGISPTGIQVGLGVSPTAVGKIHAQGDAQNTGNPLDLMIEGDGFFQVEMPSGDLAYTRAGNFKLNSNGELVTPDGFRISPTITVPANATGITIGSDGTISVKIPGQAALNNVGQLQLARFQNPAGMVAKGKNLLVESASSGTPTVGNPGEDGYGTINQGFLEGSNVSVVEEVVQMVSGQRAYEANSKVIQTADQMLSYAVNLKR